MLGKEDGGPRGELLLLPPGSCCPLLRTATAAAAAADSSEFQLGGLIWQEEFETLSRLGAASFFSSCWVTQMVMLDTLYVADGWFLWQGVAPLLPHPTCRGSNSFQFLQFPIAIPDMEFCCVASTVAFETLGRCCLSLTCLFHNLLN